MVVWRMVFAAVAIVCLISSAGCIGTDDLSNTTASPTLTVEETESQTLQSFGFLPKNTWMVHSFAESYHENPVLAELRAFMNQTWYPKGPVLGWTETMSNITLYVDAEHPPSYEEMERIYQEWKKAAGLNGSVPFMNESLNMADIPLKFETVSFSPDDTEHPVRIQLLAPKEGDVYWGDVVPHTIRVDVRIFSKYGLESAEVESVFYDENGSTRIVSTPLPNHVTTVFVPTITGAANVSVVAVDMRGNVARKTVNITQNSGMPFGPRG